MTWKWPQTFSPTLITLLPFSGRIALFTVLVHGMTMDKIAMYLSLVIFTIISHSSNLIFLSHFSQSDRLYRSDFFPGLGWMMIKSVWEEYRTQWPPAYWDDWLRHPDRRHGRACIRPEVSRTYTFGEQGTSHAQ